MRVTLVTITLFNLNSQRDLSALWDVRLNRKHVLSWQIKEKYKSKKVPSFPPLQDGVCACRSHRRF